MNRRWWFKERAMRKLLVMVTVASLVSGLLIVAEAFLVSLIVARVYLEHVGWITIQGSVIRLLGVILARAVVAGLTETLSANLANSVQVGLRERVVQRLMDYGPLVLNEKKTGELVDLLVQGIDDLEVFLARYVPQIAVTALVPLTLLVFASLHDWITGLILLVTAPLIPFFMMLIGRQAELHDRGRWQSLQRLSSYFLDVLQGLETLKLFGQSQGQSEGIASSSEGFRMATMMSLRTAFLSALALELLASLSLALVAVSVGLRVIDGVLSFQTALFLLILVPDFYGPWRALGSKFHEGLKGMSAAGRLFDMLSASAFALSHGKNRLSSQGPWPLELHGVSFHYPGQQVDALQDLDLRIGIGEQVALVGPSGSGKSTLLSLLMGFGIPCNGQIRVNGLNAIELNQRWWRTQVTLVSQQPYLYSGTIADNLRLGCPNASWREIQEACHRAGAAEFIEEFPKTYDTPLGERGARLSGGQIQRLALARAFLRDTPILLMDEPTAHLDLSGEEALMDNVRSYSAGRTLIVVAHRLAIVDKVGRVIVLNHGRVVQDGSPQQLHKDPGLFEQMSLAYEAKGVYHAPSLDSSFTL